MCLGGSPSHKEQGGVARQVKDGKPAKNQPSPSHSQCKLEIRTLRQDLKVCMQNKRHLQILYYNPSKCIVCSNSNNIFSSERCTVSRFGIVTSGIVGKYRDAHFNNNHTFSIFAHALQ